MCYAWLVKHMSAVLEMICVRFFFQRKSIDNAGLFNVVHEIIIYMKKKHAYSCTWTIKNTSFFFIPITSAYFLCLKLKFDIIFYTVPFKELSYKLDTNSTHYCTDVARNIQINKSFTLITMLWWKMFIRGKIFNYRPQMDGSYVWRSKISIFLPTV